MKQLREMRVRVLAYDSILAYYYIKDITGVDSYGYKYTAAFLLTSFYYHHIFPPNKVHVTTWSVNLGGLSALYSYSSITQIDKYFRSVFPSSHLNQLH